MALRDVRLPPDVQAAIRSMHPELKRRVRAAIDDLRKDASRGKPLVEELEGWWTLRIGQIRVVYRPVRSTLEIAMIGPRSTIYLDAVRRLLRSHGTRARLPQR